MDIELIKTFLEVKDCRHFGKASENLYLTQAAISTRIRQLERYFGVTLFHRARNNIQLTIAGERLVPHAENMLNSLRMAKQEVALAAEHDAQISIAGTPNTWDIFIHDAISKIYKEQPQISLIAEILSREQLTRKLLEHTLDVAILFDPPKVEELKRFRDRISSKFYYLADAPAQDNKGNPSIVRYSRKTKEQYVMTEVEGKATGWTAKYIDGKWVEDIPKPKKKVTKKKVAVKKKTAEKEET